MAQTIKFVNTDGSHRIVHNQTNLTVKDVEAMTHDLKASWFSLIDGHYAKPKKRGYAGR